MFHVAIDIFETETTRYADVVLPAASFLEFDDIIVPYHDYTLSAQVKACEPIGEALPNQEIFRRLAEKVGLTDAALFERDEAIIESILIRTTQANESFEQLRRLGTVQLRDKHPLLSKTCRLATRSGKIEISTARDIRPGSTVTPASGSSAKPARIRLLTPAHEWSLNSTYADVPQLRRLAGEPTIALSSLDAQERSITNGDLVVIENDLSHFGPLRACISSDVRVGVAFIPKSATMKINGKTRSINCLYDGSTADIGESSAVQSLLVDVIASDEWHLRRSQ